MRVSPMWRDKARRGAVLLRQVLCRRKRFQEASQRSFGVWSMVFWDLRCCFSQLVFEVSGFKILGSAPSSMF